MNTEKAVLKDNFGGRLITKTDILAKDFSSNQFDSHELLGKLLGIPILVDSFENWSGYPKNEDTSLHNWGPKIVKSGERWLIKPVRSMHGLGIDSLKAGIKYSLKLGDKVLVPYIHFGTPFEAEDGPIGDFQREHQIASVEFILFNGWQVDELDTILKEFS